MDLRITEVQSGQKACLLSAKYMFQGNSKVDDIIILERFDHQH